MIKFEKKFISELEKNTGPSKEQISADLSGLQYMAAYF